MFLFGLAPAAAAPKEPVDCNQGGKVDVYSIYKETHSSDDPATRERHYAGWTTDRDSAIWHANEIYEGRDSMEAALVIGNGPKGVEVVYRIGEDNWNLTGHRSYLRTSVVTAPGPGRHSEESLYSG